MQKTKPIEYLQSVLYHIKYNWRIIATVIFAITTVIFALIWASTQEDIHYYIAVGAGVLTVVVACLAHAQELCKIADKFGLRVVPEDEEG